MGICMLSRDWMLYETKHDTLSYSPVKLAY
jgi:hypothetical protein